MQANNDYDKKTDGAEATIVIYHFYLILLYPLL